MHSLNTLQFNQLLDLIAASAQTPMGKRRFESLSPLTNRLELERDLLAIKETTLLAAEGISWSFSELMEPEDAIAILRIKNTSLEPAILREFARLLSQALFAKQAIQEEKGLAPTLFEIVEALPKDLSRIADKITKKILPGGELSSTASPELDRLRREINAQRGGLTKSLESLMRLKGDAVQDEIVTVRNGRFVIPVKSNFSGKIKGVAHGTSSSGATVFIEPLDSIEANNELQILKAKEEQEISRILFSLAEELRQSMPFIELAVEAVTELDFIKAKVEFARTFNAIVPTISENETLDLVDARHPLLEESLRNSSLKKRDGENRPGVTKNLSRKQPQPLSADTEIVPVSFSLLKERSVMIISGANAGGKTVVLKTAGLLSLMAISGLPVPAKEAVIPFYASVLADIGDNQSLSANLSTFSSHISNIASMMKGMQTPALVLLDEVGTGTDPEEGSALGVAVVDHFRRNGAQIIASTHYKGLKIYAANDETINASVEFNEKTLEPTYRLLTGIAGASSGLEIARRFGIPDDIIESARKNLDASAQRAEDYLHKLQKETRQAENFRAALEDEREATAEKYAALDVQFRKKEKQRQKQFEAELGQTVIDFERKSGTFIKTVEDKKERRRLEKELEINKAELKRQAFNIKAKLDNKTGSDQRLPADRHPDDFKIENRIVSVGSKVLLTRLGTTGEVEKLDGANAEILVGSMRIRQKTEDLQVIADRHETKDSRLKELKKSARQSNINIELSEVRSELNLIGQTTLEAETEVDKFLDDSYVSKLQKVRIVHGFGTGALKTAVHKFLKGHPHVSSFGFAPQNEGGNGATVVEIKQY